MTDHPAPLHANQPLLAAGTPLDRAEFGHDPDPRARGRGEGYILMLAGSLTARIWLIWPRKRRTAPGIPTALLRPWPPTSRG